MKYNLRFGILTDDGWRGFATIQSEHLPLIGELVYLGDKMIDNIHDLPIDPAITIYRVVQRITNYNELYHGDGCTAIDITVEATPISQ